jgi:hypothetical protein
LLIFLCTYLFLKVHHNLTTYSASTFTIVRIPYLHRLERSSDFLYAAVDVSIWSVTETGLAILACASTTLRPLFRTFSSHLSATFKESLESPRNAWPSARAGYARNGRSNYRGFEETIGVEGEKRTNSISGNDAIYLARWVGDSDRSSVGADMVSNSSQSNLKADEENGLSPTDSVFGIRKTVVISTHSERI